jgi:hypothetical protein
MSKEVNYTLRKYNTPGLPQECYIIDEGTGLPIKGPTLDTQLAETWLKNLKGDKHGNSYYNIKSRQQRGR